MSPRNEMVKDSNVVELRFSNAMDADRVGTGCAACGGALFGSVKLCRGCRRRKMIKLAVGSFIAAELAMAAFFMILQPSLKGTPVVEDAYDTAAPPASPAAAASQHAMTGWLYYNTQDSVVGDVTHHARLISDSPRNPSGDPRLSGVSSGTLELASSERYGRVVMVSFPRVKTACQANPCEVRAIFDATQPMVFSYTDASSDRSTVLMLKDYDRFNQRLSVAHDLTLVAALGTEHDHIITFDVSGFRRMAMARRPALTRLAAR